MDDITRTPQTHEASTVHKPFAVGGKGLWGTGHQLPAYIQSVAHHLVSQGMDESRAIGEAVGIVKNWAHGHDGHGHAVHPDVQAAATKAIAEWERLRAQAHATRSGMDTAEEILRAGKWKHEWVPVDYTAAKEKGHGHVPKGWQPGGTIRKPPDAAPARHGWEPGPNDRHIQVEMVGTGGTSMGAFHRRKDAAHLYQQSDGAYEVRSHDTHEVLGQVRPSSKPGHFVGESVYEPTGETNREYHGPDFMKAVHGVLGHPAYGYSWYRVKREGHTMPKSRKATRSGPLDMSAAEEILRAWDPSKHARVGKGQAGGGEFAPASGSSSSSSTAKGAKGAKGKTTKHTRPTPTNAHPVGMGETGQRVHDLQERLNALGAHLKVDGIFGPKTRAAVEAFQRSHGLKVDALVGPKTTAALRLKAKAPAHKAAHPAAHHTAAKPAVKAVPARQLVHVKRDATGDSYDQDGLDASWDDLDGLPDLTGLDIADFEAITEPADAPVSRAMPKLGTGARFAALKAKLAAKGASDPGALAAYIGRKKFGRKHFTALAAKAHSHKGGRGMHRSELIRTYPLEDIHILTRAEGDGSGRVVEAYATVFDQEAEIHDGQGHYKEVIDRSAFDAVLHRISRSPGGLPAAVKVLFNHGRTMGGVEAPEFQLPLGKPLDVRPEQRGLLTRTEYDASDPFTERVLSKIHAGTITAQSFVGGIMRSTPELRGPGDRYRAKNGALTTVRRMILGLREYGPVLYPAYTGAEILGVRMQLPGSLEDDPAIDDELTDTTLDEEFDPGMEGDDAGGIPEEVHPTREHAHRLYALRTQQMFREAGIAPLNRGY